MVEWFGKVVFFYEGWFGIVPLKYVKLDAWLILTIRDLDKFAGICCWEVAGPFEIAAPGWVLSLRTSAPEK